MEKIKELNDFGKQKVIINPELDKYDTMPIFQNKMDIATAFLEEHPFPESFWKEHKNRRIKYRFQQKNMSVEEIAAVLKLPESEVLLCLEEMGLVEPVSNSVF